MGAWSCMVYGASSRMRPQRPPSMSQGTLHFFDTPSLHLKSRMQSNRIQFLPACLIENC